MTIQAVLDLDEPLVVEAAGLHAIWLNRAGIDDHHGVYEPPAQQLTALSQLPAALAALQ